MDPELAALSSKAATETDDAQRYDYWVEIQKQMEEKNSPAIVLLQAGKTWAYSSRVDNLVTSAVFGFDCVSLDVHE